jgi:predicted DsbA family dithiol-disulfide isomerase
MSDPITLEVFTDFVCPWCYLSTPRIEKVRRNFDIDVRWSYFPLHPDTPPEGRTLADLFAGRMDPAVVNARMKERMDAEGLPYGRRTHTYNSRLAQELAKAFDAVRDPLYRAYFADSRNIGDIGVLVDVASAAGIPADAALRVLTDRTFRHAVDADWERARRSGITAVPSFAAGGRTLVGTQPYDVLEKFVIDAGATRKAGVPTSSVSNAP